MKDFKLHPATVISNTDLKKQGKVQFKIEHLMDEVLPADLPWASPFRLSFGGSDTAGISCIPEEDSKVWVFFMDDTFYREAYYMADMKVDSDLFDNIHKQYESTVKFEVGSLALYPDVKFITFDNGICIAVSSSTAIPEITIYHPKMYLFVDQLGFTYFKDAYMNRIRIDNTGLRLVDMSNNEIASTPTSWIFNKNLEVLK